MRFLDALRVRPDDGAESRFSFDEYLAWVAAGDSVALRGSKPDKADGTFPSMVGKAHFKSPVISSAVTARALLISQVRFGFRQAGKTQVDDQVRQTPDLARLDRPGSMTRPELLYRLEQDVSYAGNAYVVAGKRNTLHRLAPDKVTFVFGSDSDPTWDDNGEARLPHDAVVKALIYNPSTNPHDMSRVEVFLPGEFAHWAPEPHPTQWWKGASWVQSLLEDLAVEGQIADHQSKFFENAATPKLLFLMDPTLDSGQVKEYAALINKTHAGSGNAHKNMFVGGGTDVRVVGSDFSKIGFNDLQATIEIRASMRSRVPAVILGTRDSLSGSSLNAGNYGSARRMLADGWFSPTVETLCAAFETLTKPPAGYRLGADLRHVMFLQEDQKDAAEIEQTKAAAIRSLVDGGFDPETIIATIAPDWVGTLKHTGNVSVQLQPAGEAGTTGNADSGDGDTP